MTLSFGVLASWDDLDAELDATALSWFAIRQPAMIELLRRRLWDGEGEAFALALDASCRLAARLTALDGEPPPRLSPGLLQQGLALARAEGCDPAVRRWVRWRVDAAPVALTGAQQATVTECVSAFLWAVAAADVAGLGASPARAAAG